MAAPPVRLLVDHDDHCQVLVTDALGAVSPVLKAVAEGWSPGDDDTVLNMRGRVVLCTPPAPIVELFLAFLVREDEVAPLALLPHTAPLIEVADFLAVDIDEQFKKERWIGPRTTASAMYARTQLARRAKCLFFVKNLLNAWFDYFSCTPQICFVTKRAVPHHHFKNELDASVDGKPFMNVLDAPNNHVPVVVAGRLPPSSATLSSEEGAGNLQREWMNDIYQLCADDEGRDLLVRSISCHPLKVRALHFVAVTTERELNNIQEFGATAFLVSTVPRLDYRVRGDRNGDRDGGRRANESMPRRAHQGHSRTHSRGRKRDRST